MLLRGPFLWLAAAASLGCPGEPQEAECPPDAAGVEIVAVGTVAPRVEFEFSPLVADESVDLVFGSQRAWMLVLALEVDPPPAAADPPRVTMILSRAEDGGILSAVYDTPFPVEQHFGRTFVTGPFLPLEASDPVLRTFDWDGSEVDLEVRLEPGCADPVETAIRLRLEL